MPRLLTATADDGKAVWDSMARPTVRGVAQALLASGKYHPVTGSTIHRWKQRGWAPAQAGNTGKRPALEAAADQVDVAVPILTGDPTTRTADVLADPKALALRADLTGLADDALIKLAARETYITSVILLRLLADHPEYAVDDPKGVGTLQKALAASITAANGGFAQLLDLSDRLMKLAPRAEQVTIENDPLTAALAAFEKAEREHAA